MKLLFFNRYPIIDLFVSNIASMKFDEIKIIRTLSELRTEAASNRYQTLLMNIDDRLVETSYISEIILLHKSTIRIIIFGQYESQALKLAEAGVDIFLSGDLQTQDLVKELV